MTLLIRLKAVAMSVPVCVCLSTLNESWVLSPGPDGSSWSPQKCFINKHAAQTGFFFLRFLEYLGFAKKCLNMELKLVYFLHYAGFGLFVCVVLWGWGMDYSK